MSRRTTTLVALALCFGLMACDGERPNPYEVKKSGSVDLHSYEKEMTPEELAEARKAAGHDSMDEIAAENAKMFEKGAQEYIKTRMPEYRDALKELRAFLDRVEKQAPKWKDDAAFDKFNDKYKKDVKAFLEVYDVLTGKGAEGGNTQADLGRAVREWEALNNDIGPGVVDNENFPKLLEDIRARLTTVEQSLDKIEADETLEVNKDYKPPKKTKK